VATKTDATTIVKRTPGITPGQARDARARAWVFIFDCYAKKTAAEPAQLNEHDAKEISNEFSATSTVPR
jgi:hypothetical protein